MPYTQNGSASIHYEVEGRGEPLVLIAGTGFDMSLWDPLLPTLADFRVLRLDNRGSGLSSCPDERYRIQEMADDVVAAMDAADMASAHVYGTSMGSLIAQEVAIRHPDRVRSLLLGATFSGGTTFVRALPLAPLLLFPGRYEPEECFRRTAPYLRREAVPLPGEPYFGHASGPRDPIGMRRQVQAQVRYSSLTRLRRISAPTLVMHGENDRLIPRANAWLAAKLIPRAHLRLIKGAGHIYHLDNPDDASEAMLDFLLGAAQDVIGRSTPGHGDERARVGTAALLFTDIVGSTEHLARLGDDAWTRLLARHDEATRQALERFRGTEVKTTGDGFLALFDAPGDALDCATAIMEAAAALHLRLRAGVHWGEFEIADGDIHGLAVHVAARIMDRAPAGEVYASALVAELCRGDSHTFVARGEHDLKGVPGDWALFALEKPTRSDARNARFAEQSGG